MRLAVKNYAAQPNRFKAKLFTIKKDRKKGIVVDSPPINWKELNELQSRLQWMSCQNYLWEMEKNGVISKEDFFPMYYNLVEKSGYKSSYIRKLKDNDIPFTVLITTFLVLNGAACYAPGIKYLKDQTKALIEKGKQLSTPAKIVEKISIKDSPTSILIDKIHEFEDNIFKKKPDFEKFMKDNNVLKWQAEYIYKWYAPRFVEVALIYKESDEQLNEAYRKLSKAQKLYMVKWYASLAKALKEVDTIAITRIRKSKPITPEKMIKKLKYMKEFDELEIKSINPIKIIGSSILWAYNTKTRKLLLYRAKDGYTFGIEGTTLVNFDEKKSFSKTLRKPEIQIKEFNNLGKKIMLDYFNKIKSVNSEVSGRINSDMVLLSVG